ncbi:cytochrome b561, partial [Candidatus Thiomargarita nelsonii]
LIIGTVLIPISGFMMSAMGGHGVDLFGLELVAHNANPMNPPEVIPLNASLAQIGHTLHYWAGYILIAAVVLHVIGAFKHHIIDKDGTLQRMLGAEV